MKDENRRKRHEAISAAAYDLLARHGYGGTTMLRIARAAKASNETLYRWYGDKDGLFRQMIEDNVAETRDILSAALEQRAEPMQALAQMAPVLLRMLLGDRAILLNRAAAADPSGALGRAISAGGRAQIRPLLAKLLVGIDRDADGAPGRVAGRFVDLLVGDLQIRRVIGEIPALTEEDIAQRCAAALSDLRVLMKTV